MAFDKLLLHLLVDSIPFLTIRQKLRLLATMESPEQILRLSRSELLALASEGSGFWSPGPKETAWKPAELLRKAQARRGHLTAGGIGCTFYAENSYPPLLKEIDDPPILLYYRGRWPDWRKTAVAVVGTRKPTGRARRAAYRLGHDLSLLDVITVSGLALGIDSEAHRGSLDGGGTTVAVLGNGVDILYPHSSSGLARRILAEGGILLSEYPPGTPPLPEHFPARNRIISGLCGATVIVEAPRRSGALITAEFALEQNRDVYVHSAGLEGSAGEGTRELEEYGATVIGGAEDLAAGWSPAAADYPRPGIVEPGETAGRRLARLLELELQDAPGPRGRGVETCGIKRSE